MPEKKDELPKTIPLTKGLLPQGKLPIIVTGLEVKIVDERFEIKKRQ